MDDSSVELKAWCIPSNLKRVVAFCFGESPAASWLLHSLLFSFLFFVTLFLSTCRRRRQTPINWPVVGMLPAILSNFHHLHDYLSDLLCEARCNFMFKGPWFSGMDFFVTSDPANVHHVFNANYSNYPKGHDFADIFDVLGGSLFGADGDSWKAQRKLAHVSIGDKAFRSLVVVATKRKAAEGLLPLLGRVAASGAAVDLENVFSRLAFDLMSDMVFGSDPGSLSLPFPTVPLATAIDDFWEAAVFRQAVPRSWWKILRRLRLGPERKMARAGEVIDSCIAELISKKREERRNLRDIAADDLLTKYMDQPFEEVAKFFESEDRFLRDTVLFLIIAGRDAFSIGLSWFFWLLSKNPDVESKILQELQMIKRDDTTVFDADEVGSMVYLHGAVCEALRLYVPVPVETKCAVRDDVLPSGHRVAAGMKILVSVYAMGRMEEIWGGDCMEFRPERWINERGKTRHVPAYKYMVFNSGPRSCLGKDIGLMQLKMVLAAVVWNFETEVMEGQVVEPKNAAMLKMKNGLRVRVKKRVISAL